MTTRAEGELSIGEQAMGADLDTMLVFSILRTQSRLGSTLDAELRKQHITATQLNMLLVLRSAGEEGLAMGQIGERLVVTKSNVTALADRMERAGLVRRTVLADRRSTAVSLTPRGAAVLEQVAPRHARHVSSLTDCLSDQEKGQLIRLLSKLRRGLRQARQEARK